MMWAVRDTVCRLHLNTHSSFGPRRAALTATSCLISRGSCTGLPATCAKRRLLSSHHFAWQWQPCQKRVQQSRFTTVRVQAAVLPGLPAPAGILLAVFLLVAALKKVLDKPARTYDPDNPNVGRAYDDWTREGVLEYYWGDHVHLGYYTAAERAAGYKKKDFKQAKVDFVNQMLSFAGSASPRRILDVGCGIGGTSRMLASRFPQAEITGITLSHQQAARATELAQQQGLRNCHFQVMDALQMEFPDSSFDLVWACESGEHMPDKGSYVQEMMRVLSPGGNLAIATWCQRDLPPGAAFSAREQKQLKFLYEEWAHPYFASKEEYARILQGTAGAEKIHVEDWTPETLPTWWHSIWVGIWDPWIVIFKGPVIWYKTIREIIMIECMHRGFAKGLMEYGMIRATKALAFADNQSAPRAAVCAAA